MLVKGNKKDSRLIRWLQKNASTDVSRPVLNGLHVNNGQTVACNGYRMIVVDTPEPLKEIEGPMVVKGKIPAGDFAVEFEEIEGKYPDYNGIIPTKEAKAVISINPKLLREMLEGLDDTPTTIVLHEDTQPIEIFGKTRDERDAYMILMPMHRAVDNKLNRPNGTTVKIKASESNNDKVAKTS
jgi:DNA polymerase III sliding clamp (beta) subunit (PCNA family)